jgi:hypothetical protein
MGKQATAFVDVSHIFKYNSSKDANSDGDTLSFMKRGLRN